MQEGFEDTREIYDRVRLAREWWEKASRSLLNNASMAVRRNWTLVETLVSNYFLDVYAFNAEELEAYEALVDHVSEVMGMESRKVLLLFSLASQSVLKSYVPTLDFVSFKETKAVDTTEILIGSLRIIIPNLLGVGDVSVQELTRFLLRYDLVTKSGTLLYTYGYNVLSLIGEDALECFTTPFSFMLDNYCTYFEEDVDVLSGCKGTFLKYETRDDEKLVLVPPHIESVVNDACIRVVSTFNENKSFLAILPNWQDLESITGLIELNGSCFDVLNASEYHMYNKLKDTLLTPLHDTILVIVNVRGNVSESESVMASVRREIN